jgi:hypothetical protein
LNGDGSVLALAAPPYVAVFSGAHAHQGPRSRDCDGAIITGMANRNLQFAEWLKLVGTHFFGDHAGNIIGFPAADVAKRLGVSRQRVEQLVKAETLDTVSIVNPKGRVYLVLITDASIDRYLARRVPDVRGRKGYFSFPA